MTADKPTEAPEVAVSEPEPDRWQPIEQPAPAPQPEQSDQPARAPGEVGTPAGQLAVGAASVLTLGGLGLYQTVGVLGLVAGGATAAAGAGGYGYYRWRQAHPRKRRDRSERSTTANRTGSGKDLFSTSRSGRRAAFSAPGRSNTGGRSTTGRSAAGGRATRIPPLAGNPNSRAGGKRMTFPAGQTSPRGADRSRVGRPPRARTPAQTAAHAATAPLRAARRASRATGQRLAQAGRATRAYASPRLARARTSSRLLDERTGSLASRTGQGIARGVRAAARRVAPHLRHAGGWVDRRTGQRASTAWAAALTGGRHAAVKALTGRYRRWDAHATAALVTLAAWLTRPLRRRNDARRASVAPSAPQGTNEQQAAPSPTGRPELRLITTPNRGASMNALISHAIEMPTIASAYESDDMMDVKADMELLREIPLAVAAAIRIWTERLAVDYPLHNDVIEQMNTFYEGFCSLASNAEEVSSTFQTAHERDIRRRLEPRTGEQKWNAR